MNGDATEEDDVAIIGGGVIGVCCAYYLARAGISATLLERDQICCSCSCGNAGLVVPSYSIPLTTPDTLRKALESLLIGGPFQISQSINWELVKWFARFVSACKRERVTQSTRVLRDLVCSSAQLYEELAPLFEFGFENKGSLELFATKHGLNARQRESKILEELGIESCLVPGTELPEIDPLISAHLEGGILHPQDAHLIPAEFVTQLASLAEKSGARVRTGVNVLGFRVVRPDILALKTTVGEYRARTVVVAAGAWSPLLASQLDVLPMQAGKGYGFSVDSSSFSPKMPLLLKEARIAVTPMGGTVRFTGGLDLSGLEMSINVKQLRLISNNARRYFANPLPKERTQLWSGLRPCTPDGLPVISRSVKQKNVVLATGHGMLGMTLGPITGKLVSDLIVNDTSDVQVPELSLSRFG